MKCFEACVLLFITIHCSFNAFNASDFNFAETYFVSILQIVKMAQNWQ